MKIALFTIWHEKNYGAEMQAYATIRALSELGHDVTIVDFRLSDVKPMSLKGKVVSLIEHISPCNREFEAFWARYFSKRVRYTSIEKLRADCPKSDLYLVGSDQTWNVDITKAMFPIFLLDFGNKDTKRAAYASSFGKNTWEESAKLTEIATQAFSNFDFLSCREKTGCDILQQVFGVNAINVIDPTLLHSNYREIIGDVEEKNILTYYPLDTDPELEIYAKKIAYMLNLIPVNVNNKKCLGKVVWKRTSIEDWIRSIASAKLVVTRSFHGLAFSLIYNRQFVVVNNSNRSSRLADLLASLGLENRMFKSMEEMMQSKIWEENIDYDIINQKLNSLRKSSWNYLKQIQ